MTHIAVFDPDVIPEKFWSSVTPVEGDPPFSEEAREALLAYRLLVRAYSQDRLGLPRPAQGQGPAMLTVSCGARTRGQAHVLARAFRIGQRALFVGAYDLSRGTVRLDGCTVQTLAYVKVGARFLDATRDAERYVTRCRCTGNNVGTWLSRAAVRDLVPAGHAHLTVPASAVLSR